MAEVLSEGPEPADAAQVPEDGHMLRVGVVERAIAFSRRGSLLPVMIRRPW